VTKQVRYMAQCAKCPEPKTPWEFSTYLDRANWIGQHRVKTGHPIRVWLQKP
jgi:hypothetical protein